MAFMTSAVADRGMRTALACRTAIARDAVGPARARRTEDGVRRAERERLSENETRFGRGAGDSGVNAG
jgi:hypothetical protein